MSNETSITWNFRQYFENKAFVAPYAEKSLKNLTRQITLPPRSTSTEAEKEQLIRHRLYYFAMGHKWKNLHNVVFQPFFDENGKQHTNDYVSLQKEKFPEKEKIQELIDNLRNLNNHYVHDFQKISFNEDNNDLRKFLKESFRMAATMVYFDHKNIWKELYDEVEKEVKKVVEGSSKNNNSKPYVEKLQEVYKKYIADQQFKNNLHSFLFNRFFPNKEKKEGEKTSDDHDYDKLRKEIGKSTLDSLLEKLLFVRVSSDYEWKINNEHAVFTIKQGEYLSFVGALFALCMFLYKDEAYSMMSSMDEYQFPKKTKKEKTEEEKAEEEKNKDEMMAKRNIMTFFSKKISAQDIDCEEKSLIYFRDIILYLNKYPLEWNKALEKEVNADKVFEVLKKEIAEMEENRILDVCLTPYPQRTIQSFILSDNFDKIPDVNKKMIDEQVEAIQKDVEKLAQRLKENTFFTSYGRNQDRFMEFALRYLAERNYFGSDAQFKCYRFYTTEEQNVFLESEKERLPKKEFDKIKFHRGRVVYFSTLADHRDRYPDWDTPFVFENNAIQIRITLNDKTVLLSIQRPLLVCLVQHCLMQDTPEGKGKNLLEDYYAHYRENLATALTAFGKSKTEVSSEDKNIIEQLFPRRAVKRWATGEEVQLTNKSLIQLLEEAERSEDRYRKKMKEVEETARKTGNPNLLVDFLKKNKGKQFKLRFVKKAWHLMYFKPVYKERYDGKKHHKSYHLTREEYNDFCRYMFAYDVAPDYQRLLRELLESKGFLANPELAGLFEKCQSLDDFYQDTKEIFKTWISTSVREQRKDRFQLSMYKNFSFNQEVPQPILYINLQHFLNHVKKDKGEQKYAYPLPQNQSYLISSYYFKDHQKSNNSTLNKLHFKLRNTCVEDCLLYEIAMYYFKKENPITDPARNKVNKILQSKDLFIEIQDKRELSKTFRLYFPFKQIEKVGSMLHNDQEKERLTDVPRYIDLLADREERKKNKQWNKEIRKIYDNYKSGKILLEDYTYLQKEVVRESGTFLSVYMEMEKFFILQEKLRPKPGRNNIVYKKITPLKTLLEEIEQEQKIEKFDNNGNRQSNIIRNDACHFSFPQKLYDTILIELEKKFIKKYVSSPTPLSFQDFPAPIRKVLDRFSKSVHNSLFQYKIKNQEERIATAQREYINQVIKKYIQPL